MKIKRKARKFTEFKKDFTLSATELFMFFLWRAFSIKFIIFMCLLQFISFIHGIKDCIIGKMVL
ncbi:hypothetical protein D3Z36_01840 [Lachnospiraceae bacterium]|nr:hypothetical protein [Lachnospiraceae bacterium]